jgi:hypothetical protein
MDSLVIHDIGNDSRDALDGLNIQKKRIVCQEKTARCSNASVTGGSDFRFLLDYVASAFIADVCVISVFSPFLSDV